MQLEFRCPEELLGWLPEPIPAARGLPEWLRSMPAEAPSALAAGLDDTVKRCPPFLDAMGYGFLMPLMCDVRIEAGEFLWDADLPSPASAPYPRSPIGLHDPAQVSATPFFEEDRFLFKFHNLWTLRAPEGWSMLITHPANRNDLPFTTLTGLVACDRYRDLWIHFPAVWRDTHFSGVLPRGTPVAQCIPIRREDWSADIASLSANEAEAARALAATIGSEKGVYRKRFRA